MDNFVRKIEQKQKKSDWKNLQISEGVFVDDVLFVEENYPKLQENLNIWKNMEISTEN